MMSLSVAREKLQTPRASCAWAGNQAPYDKQESGLTGLETTQDGKTRPFGLARGSERLRKMSGNELKGLTGHCALVRQ